ncbi:MAG: hypothetical protein CM15mP93_14230 [Thiotrichaceae bacterium]|nr:MAG: hypothetical protein CM15mP93_14230 [Thiotrichaceae bacterium]
MSTNPKSSEDSNHEITGAEIFVKVLQPKALIQYSDILVLYCISMMNYINRQMLIIYSQTRTRSCSCAEGYAKSSDKPGVVIVTSGPGATNAITGIADAYMDSVPIVVFTGQVRTALIGNDAFQEVDTVGITRPCVKHNFMITDVNKNG